MVIPPPEKHSSSDQPDEGQPSPAECEAQDYRGHREQENVTGVQKRPDGRVSPQALLVRELSTNDHVAECRDDMQ